jgi:glucokinase
MDYVIGVDIGATKIHSARVSLNGSIVQEYKTMTESSEPTPLILNKIKHSIDEVMTKEVIGVGFGIPGPIDEKTWKCYPPNIPNLKGINFFKKFKHLKLPIAIENDSNCFALAEQKFGQGKGKKNFVGITLGTGVGGGIIIDGKIYKGKNGAAGELGHITIDRDGYLCNCGNHGCLEMYASGTAIQMRTLRHLNIKDIPSRLKEEQMSALKVHYAALRGDKLAKKIMGDTGKYLGIGVSAIINTFNPEIIILGGAVANTYRSFAKSLNATIKERAMTPANKIKVVPSKLKHPGTMGAAAVIIDKLMNEKDIAEKNENNKKRNLGFLRR